MRSLIRTYSFCKYNRFWFYVLFACLFCASTKQAAAHGGGGVKQHFPATPLKGTAIVYENGAIKTNALINGQSIAQFAPDNASSIDVLDVITLSLVEESPLFIPQDFSAEVTFNIEYRDLATNNLNTLSGQKLSVNYTKNGGTKYKSRDYISFKGANYVHLTVTAVTPSTLIGGSLDVKNVLQLDNEIRTTSYYALPYTAPAITGLAGTAAVPANGGAPDELHVTWSPGAGYSYAQLEWMWLEDELNSYPSDANGVVTNAAVLFSNNATRVDLAVDVSGYNVPLMYDGAGKLYFRIRPASIDAQGGITVGPWSDVQHYVFSTGHNPNLNWQATTSFAEEGKRKTVVQYFDGSLRGRQTVTKDNTTNTTVVAETMYDKQGRPAIQILPAPTMDNIIKYKEGLNLFNNQSSPAADPADLFDLVPVNDDGGVPALQTTQGTAKYYSSANTEINSGTNSLLPDAKGYPFSVTRYTQDATGRIASQSGVGDQMQINSGRQTNYYYVTPAQEELDGLFGTEAGDYTHYFKNMVKDANGQLSVSYVDMHGRTIATALAGKKPSSMEPLDINNANDYENQSPQTVTHNLLGTNKSGNIIKGSNIESVNTISVSTDDQPDKNAPPVNYHVFNYTLAAPVLSLKDCQNADICFSCLYDLQISITDESGNADPFVWNFNNVQIASNGQCANPPLMYTNNSDHPAWDGLVQVNNNAITITIPLNSGSYIVRKTLTLSEKAFQQYQQQYLPKALCKTEQDVIDLVTPDCPVVNTTPPCQDCMDKLGTENNFVNDYLSGVPTPTAEQISDAQAAYTNALRRCKQLCNTYDPNNPVPVSHRLDAIKSAMLADMVPYTGQYAKNPADGGVTTQSIDGQTSTFKPFGAMGNRYNIFTGTYNDLQYNPDQLPSYKFPLFPFGFGPYLPAVLYGRNFYYDQSNNVDASITPNKPQADYGILNNMSVDDFAQAFKPSWAQSLLRYHPEIAKLDFATAHLAKAYAWADQDFSAKQTYDDANAVNVNYIYNPTAADPYFSVNSSDLNNMNGFITSSWNGKPSLWNIAYNSVACAEFKDQASINQCGSNNTGFHDATSVFTGANTYINTQARRDKVWSAFKALYLIAREVLINKYINTNTSTVQGTIDAGALVSEGYTLHFPVDNSLIAQQYGVTGWFKNPDDNSTPTGQPTNTNLGGVAQGGRCAEYIPGWQKELLQCSAMTTGAYTGTDNIIHYPIIEEITGKLQAICDASTNDANPFGATTLADDAPAINGYKTFKDVVNGVMQSHGIPISQLCNAYVIDFPKPHSKGPIFNQTYIDKLEDCTCKRYAKILSDAGSAVTDFTTLNIYLQAKYNEQITQDMYDALQHCSEIGSHTECHYSNPATQTVTAQPYAVPKENFENQIYQLFQVPTTQVNYYNNTYYLALNSALPSATTCLSIINSITKADPLDNNQHVGFLNFDDPNPLKIQVEVPNTLFVTEKFNNYYACPVSDPPVETCITTGIDYYPLDHPLPLPDFLTCGYQDGEKCVTCAKISELTGTYKTTFSGQSCAQAPVQHDNLSEAEVSYNKTWANYVNFFTGMQYSWQEYTKFARDKGCNLANYATNGSNTNTVVCPDDKPLTDPTNVIHVPDACDPYKNMGVSTGIEVYKRLVEKYLGDFESQYRAKCLTAQNFENFTVTYTSSEYHYTLYYYDMAGNLVKTVPPKGVHPNFSQAFINAVQQARAADQPYVPQHTMATRYCYNSLNQVTAQKTPDAGMSQFWYDALGRLAVSQNAKQANNGKYSYTVYDNLGRITEVGQLAQANVISQQVSQDKDDLADWIHTGKLNGGEQITFTIYDEPYSPVSTLVFSQHNLRNRVSYVQLYNTYADYTNTSAPHFATATYYTYDIHGNVDTLVQDYGSSQGVNNVMNASGNRFKRIVYDYDLISGKVNLVSYQARPPGEAVLPADAFYHRYEYDAENRITAVFTSRDSVYWERDAAYSYYKHGPLAQTVLGQQQVQGLTYAYTLQGWLKGVNLAAAIPVTQQCQQGTGSDVLTVSGISTGDMVYQARSVIDFQVGYYNAGYKFDAYINPTLAGCVTPATVTAPQTLPNGASIIPAAQYTFTLNYFDGDYTNINSQQKPIANTSYSAVLGTNYRPLYNGNISGMAVNITKLNTTANTAGLLYSYQYDQLNRLVGMYALNVNGNGYTTTDNYKERATYDPNGNILAYTRNGSTGTLIDDLHYNYDYYSTTNTRSTYTNGVPADADRDKLTNRLNYVHDDIVNGGQGDIESQGANNYEYDEIGNLVKNTKENIAGIDWTVYGKIAKITKTDGSIITYSYDVAGNRISKTAGTNTTWYVRDASGNVVSIYTATGSTLTQTEIPLYGNSRVGEYKPDATDAVNTITLPGGITAINSSFTRGKKVFELSNHLGNVLVTVNDRKLQVDVGAYDDNGILTNNTPDGIIDSYLADVVSAQDYYPGGMLEPGRQFSSGTQYRYGFNGKEKSDEIEGSGVDYDYGARIYDARIGRFLSVDALQKAYPSQTPYSASGNNPILLIDNEGNGPDLPPAYVTIPLITNHPIGMWALSVSVNTSANELFKWVNKTSTDPMAYYKLKGAFGEAEAFKRLMSDFAAGAGIAIPQWHTVIGANYNGLQVDIQTKASSYTSGEVRHSVAVRNFGFNGKENDLEIFGLWKDRKYTINYEVKTLSPSNDVAFNFAKLAEGIKQTIARSNGTTTIGVLVTDKQTWLNVANDPVYGPQLAALYEGMTESGRNSFLRLEDNLSADSHKELMSAYETVKKAIANKKQKK